MLKNINDAEDLKGKSVLPSYPDICSISVPDITCPGARFTVCLKVMEDLKNSIHGCWSPLQTSCRTTCAGTTWQPRSGFNPATARC